MRGLTYIAVGTLLAGSLLPEAFTQAPNEAPAAFNADGELVTNGFQTPEQFELDRAIFDEQEGKTRVSAPSTTRSPAASATRTRSPAASARSPSCAPDTSTAYFTDHPGGSLINDRAIDAAIQERVLGGNEVRTFRTSLNTLGDGFVEAIDSNTLVAHLQQPAVRRCAGSSSRCRCSRPTAPLRVGRFGWKNQHASLVSFSADAYLNEMGITSRSSRPRTRPTALGGGLRRRRRRSRGRDGEDVGAFARFMRATKAPPRDAALAATPDAQAGSASVQPDRLRDLPRPHHRHRAARAR